MTYNHRFDPYDGDNTMSLRDIESYLDDLTQEVIDELTDLEIPEDMANKILDLWPDGFEYDEKAADLEDYLHGEDYKLDKIKALQKVVDEIESYTDDGRNAWLISENVWKQHVNDEVKDLGYLPDDLNYVIESNINWDGIADDWKQDYNNVVIDGIIYYFR